MIEYKQMSHVSEKDPRTGRHVTHRVYKKVCKYTPEERIGIVREFIMTNLSAEEIMEKYHIGSSSTFFSWVGRHLKEVQSLPLHHDIENDADMANKSKEDQIRELKEKLRQAEARADMEALRAKAFSKMIDVAEETFNIPVRKKSGTRQ